MNAMNGPTTTTTKRPIGVIVSQFESSVSHELITTIGAGIRRAGHDMLLFSAIDMLDDLDRGICAALRAQCGGLLLVMPWVTPGFLRQLEASGVPTVVVNYCAGPTSLPLILGANRDGAFAAVNHLLAGGHRRIAFVGGTSQTGQSQRRQDGYEDAMRAAGIAIDPAYVIQSNFTVDGGTRAARQLLDLPHPPTAIFAANDEMAFGVIDAIHRRGLLVPDDISVVGYDDILAASYVHPTLTTVRQPLQAISHEAVRRMLDAIEGRGAETVRVEFPADFIVRGSSGPAPR
jgi:LacI family transcriptional regulator